MGEILALLKSHGSFAPAFQHIFSLQCLLSALLLSGSQLPFPDVTVNSDLAVSLLSCSGTRRLLQRAQVIEEDSIPWGKGRFFFFSHLPARYVHVGDGLCSLSQAQH